MTDTKNETCLYTVILPLSGAAVLQFQAAAGLSDEDAVARAIAGVDDCADLAVVDGGFLVEIQEWEMHDRPVNRGNTCHFSHTTPEVHREEE